MNLRRLELEEGKLSSRSTGLFTSDSPGKDPTDCGLLSTAFDASKNI